MHDTKHHNPEVCEYDECTEEWMVALQVEAQLNGFAAYRAARRQEESV